MGTTPGNHAKGKGGPIAEASVRKRRAIWMLASEYPFDAPSKLTPFATFSFGTVTFDRFRRVTFPTTREDGPRVPLDKSKPSPNRSRADSSHSSRPVSFIRRPVSFIFGCRVIQSLISRPKSTQCCQSIAVSSHNAISRLRSPPPTKSTNPLELLQS